MRNLRWLYLGLALVMALVAMAACQPTAAPAPPPTEEAAPPTPEEKVEVPTPTPVEEKPKELAKVLVTLDWVPNEYQNWMFVAMDKGFYAEEGIEVEYFVPTNVQTALIAVSTGRTNLGLSISADTILAVANEGLPVKVVCTIFPRAESGVIRYPDEVPTPADMKGKTWAIVNSDTERLMFKKVYEAGGLTEADLEIVDPGFDLLPPFLTGRAAGATSTLFAEQWLAQNEAKRRVMQFNYSDYGVQNNFNIMANMDWVKANPQLCKAFVKGSLRGLQYCMGHATEARDIFIARYPEFDPKESLAWSHAWLPQHHARYTKEKGFGWSDEKEWQALIDFYYEGGILKRKPSVDEVVTNEFLPEEPIYAHAPMPPLPEKGDSPVIDAILDAGVLRAGVAEGFLVKKEASGEYSGVGVEIAKWTADALGVKLELVESTPEAILDDLEAKKFEVAISGVVEPGGEVYKRVDTVEFPIAMEPKPRKHVALAMNKGDVAWVHFVEYLIQSNWWDLQELMGNK